MIRYGLFIVALVGPCFAQAAESEIASTQTGSAVANESASAPITFNQTFDPTSAFDGYWYPSARAIDGQEDR
jgi:hypothetical protein